MTPEIDPKTDPLLYETGKKLFESLKEKLGKAYPENQATFPDTLKMTVRIGEDNYELSIRKSIFTERISLNIKRGDIEEGVCISLYHSYVEEDAASIEYRKTDLGTTSQPQFLIDAPETIEKARAFVEQI